MAETNESPDEILDISDTVEVEVGLNFEFYGSVAEGDDYFDSRLNSSVWDDSSEKEKRNSLIEASRLIDRLNFQGEKTDVTQLLQFPRSDDAAVPRNIRFATYEVAIKLLDGIDPDLEKDDLRTSAQGYSSVRVSKDTGWVPEYIQAGIPSARAWHLLRPYLRDPLTIKLNRTN